MTINILINEEGLPVSHFIDCDELNVTVRESTTENTISDTGSVEKYFNAIFTAKKNNINYLINIEFGMDVEKPDEPIYYDELLMAINRKILEFSGNGGIIPLETCVFAVSDEDFYPHFEILTSNIIEFTRREN